MNKLSSNNYFIKKIKNFFFPFYNSNEIKKLFGALEKNKEKNEKVAMFVGGCVRNFLNNEKVDDIDIATTLSPDEIIKKLASTDIKVIETGIEHGSLTLVVNKSRFEITTLRKDVSTDGRHAKINYTNDWKMDSERRDFTINAIYMDQKGKIFDPQSGVKDLKKKIIKFIGDPEKRIKEDYLRILRYVRFFLNYSKRNHELNIKKLIKQNIRGVVNLSKDRLFGELQKLILSNGFIKLSKDEFCKEIILLIFPQLKNIDIFNKLNKYSKNLIHKKDFIFLLSLLVIDETDNSDYFIYKYNVSNETKKRINFIKEIYYKSPEKNIFSKKNLEKILYFQGKSYLFDLIDFELFKSKESVKKLIEFREYFSKREKPLFPIKAKVVMEKYNIKEGKELGQKLKNLENLWIEKNFKISNKDIDKTFLG